MRVIIVKDYEEMSARAAQIVADAVERVPEMVLGLATGSTPLGLYQRLAACHRDAGLDFGAVTTFNLDEYVGLGPDHAQSYRFFMDSHLFNHINVPAENTHVPDGLATPLLDYCDGYEQTISDAGGIDLQVLGIGRDGHVAFNEPGTSLGSRTHVACLAPETIEDNARFFDTPAAVPRFAITMGVQTILEADTCLLLATGASKADAVRAALEGPVSSSVTASALQWHPQTIAIVNEAAASKLERIDYYRWREENWRLIADKL